MFNPSSTTTTTTTTTSTTSTSTTSSLSTYNSVNPPNPPSPKKYAVTCELEPITNCKKSIIHGSSMDSAQRNRRSHAQQGRCWKSVRADNEEAQEGTKSVKIYPLCGVKCFGFHDCELHFKDKHPTEMVCYLSFTMKFTN